MAMNSLKSCLILENNLGSEGLEYYFEAPSISHLKRPRGLQQKTHGKGSRVNSILYLNDAMPKMES